MCIVSFSYLYYACIGGDLSLTHHVFDKMPTQFVSYMLFGTSFGHWYLTTYPCVYMTCVYGACRTWTSPAWLFQGSVLEKRKRLCRTKFGHVQLNVEWCELISSWTFRFISNIFWENQWMSLFKPVNAYTRLVWECYYNINQIVLSSSQHFRTKVVGTTITINRRLISEIIGIPFTNGKSSPFFFDSERQPSKVEIMAVLNPCEDQEWSNRLLEGTRAIVGLDCTAKYMAHLSQQWCAAWQSQIEYAITRRIPFCLCTHMVMTILKLYEDHSIVLPYRGLISKILTAKLPQIDGNEPVAIPEGYFGKGTMTK